MKREWKKREKIIDRTFDFLQQKVYCQIAYNGNGKAPDKRFDKSTDGLSLFIYLQLKNFLLQIYYNNS